MRMVNKMMMFNGKRFLLNMLIILIANYAIAYLLAFLGVSGIYFVLLLSFLMAVVLALLNYPAQFRKHALKDPSFHKALAIYFVVIFALNFFF